MSELTKEEKHTPIITVVSNNLVKVTVDNHPAQSQEHYLTNFTLLDSNGQKLATKDFWPEDDAVAEFEVESPEWLQATSHCNLHWVWNDKWEFLGF